MATEVTLPEMGEEVEDVTISRWLVGEGESVRAGDPLLEIATDKVETEVPAPVGGTVLAIHFGEGEIVDLNAVIAVIGEGAEEVGQPAASPAGRRGMAATQRAKLCRRGRVSWGIAKQGRLRPRRWRDAWPRRLAFPFLPLAGAAAAGDRSARVTLRHFCRVGRRLPMTVMKAGKGKMMTRARVQKRLTTTSSRWRCGGWLRPTISTCERWRGSGPGAPLPGMICAVTRWSAREPRTWRLEPTIPRGLCQLPRRRRSPAVGIPQQRPGAPPGRKRPDETLIPHSRMRQIIARNMVQSAFSAPHVTTVHSVDMSVVTGHYQAHKGEFAQQGARLTLTAYIVAALVEGLKATPAANAEWTEEGLLLKHAYHIGMAVALPADATGVGGADRAGHS